MTPFDPIALLASMRAFYPVVTLEALARARRERPELFAAGVIGGVDEATLVLQDGRRFACIAAGRWAVTQIAAPRGRPSFTRG